MDKNTLFSVIGGDLRQAYIARQLASEGYRVKCCAVADGIDVSPARRCDTLKDAMSGSRYVILPLPLTRDDVNVFTTAEGWKIPVMEIFDNLKGEQTVFAGKVAPELMEAAASSGIDLRDYFEREELTILNAVPTAEGALQLAMENMPVTLHGSRCLVIGYGRIARVLAGQLKGLCADVTVAARKLSALTWCEVSGYRAVRLEEIDTLAGGFDVIFNTAPSMVVYRHTLEKLKKECLIIDLASPPGGIDFNAAEELELNVIWALSLPGKAAPSTAGNIIKSTVLNMIEEETGCP